MTRTTTTDIRTRTDGSIDTGYYMARGRRMRSEAAHDMLRLSTRQEERPARRGFIARLTGARL